MLIQARPVQTACRRSLCALARAARSLGGARLRLRSGTAALSPTRSRCGAPSLARRGRLHQRAGRRERSADAKARTRWQVLQAGVEQDVQRGGRDVVAGERVLQVQLVVLRVLRGARTPSGPPTITPLDTPFGPGQMLGLCQGYPSPVPVE